MTIFNKLFGKRSANTEAAAIKDIGVPEAELFIQQEIPSDKDAGKKMRKDIFGEREFYLEGRRAGYATHSADGIELFLAEIRASFRKALEEDKETLLRDQTDIQMCLIQIGDMLPSKKQCLELKMKLLSNKIDEYTLQQTISVDDEGFISSFIHDFRRGYRQGIEDYFEQNLFLKGHL